MRHFIFVFILITGFSGFTYAQDLIYMVGNKTIAAEQIRVTNEKVFYIPYRDTSRQERFVERDRVERIVYADGSSYILNGTKQQITFPEEDYVQHAPLNDFSSSFPGHFIGVLAGASVPVGVYGSKDVYNISNTVGLAKTAYFIAVDGGVNLTSNFGISGTIGHFTNGFDSDYLNSQINAPEPYHQAITGGSWSHFYFLAGPMLSIATDDMVSDFRFRGGYVLTTEPDLEITTDSGGVRLETVTAIPVTSGGPMVNMGFTLRLHLSNTLSMLFALDYFYGAVEFVPEFSVVNAQGERWSTNGRRYEQEIATFHIGAGLAYRPGKKSSAKPYSVPHKRTY